MEHLIALLYEAQGFKIIGTVVKVYDYHDRFAVGVIHEINDTDKHPTAWCFQLYLGDFDQPSDLSKELKKRKMINFYFHEVKSFSTNSQITIFSF